MLDVPAECRLLTARTLAELEGLEPEFFPSGALCYVTDQASLYELVVTSEAAVASPRVVATVRGAGVPGRWIARTTGALQQQVKYVVTSDESIPDPYAVPTSWASDAEYANLAFARSSAGDVWHAQATATVENTTGAPILVEMRFARTDPSGPNALPMSSTPYMKATVPANSFLNVTCQANRGYSPSDFPTDPIQFIFQLQAGGAGLRVVGQRSLLFFSYGWPF